MTSDLRTLLHQFVESEAAASVATAPRPEAEARLLGARIARGRVLRAGGTAAGAAAAVVLLAVAVQAASPEPTPPVTSSPTPSPSSSPSATPSPTPTPTPTAASSPEPITPAPEAGPVTAHPNLPTTVVWLPPGLLTATTPDWVLLTYDGAGPDGSTGPSVLYLVGPDGTTYEVPTVLELGADPASGSTLTVEEWLPGSSLAIVLHTEGVTGRSEVVDLLTGAVLSTPTQDVAGSRVVFVGDGTTDVLVAPGQTTPDGETVVSALERRTSDGRVLAARPGYTSPSGLSDLAIDAGRTRVVVADAAGAHVLDLADLSTVATVALPSLAGDGCDRLWWVAEEIMVTCPPAGESGPATDVWATGTSGVRLVAQEVPGWPMTATAHDLLVYDWTSSTLREVRPDGSVGLDVLAADLTQAHPVPGGAVLVSLPHEGIPPIVQRYDSASDELEVVLVGVYPSVITAAR